MQRWFSSQYEGSRLIVAGQRQSEGEGGAVLEQWCFSVEVIMQL